MINLIRRARAMGTIILFAALGCFILAGEQAHARSDNPKPLVILIFDNAGTAAIYADELKDLKKRVLWNMRKPPRHLRGAAIKVLSVHATRVLFSGDSRSIRRQADELVPLLEYEATGCADLVGAFQLAKELIEEDKPSRAAIISIGGLIHSGSPCSSTISLPQAVPAGLPLKAFAQMEITVLALGAHRLQRQAYGLAFRRAGLKNGKVLGVAESKALLRKRGGLADAL